MRAQIGAHLRFDIGRIRTDIEHGRLRIRANSLGESAAALERERISCVVVHADKGLDAVGLGAQPRFLARQIFGLPYVHQCTKVGALLLGTRIGGDERDVLCLQPRDRAFEQVEVGDGRDNSVIVTRCRLVDQLHHVGNIPVRRIAIVSQDVEIIVGLLDAVLDRVPPRIRVWRMSDEIEMGNRFCVHARA